MPVGKATANLNAKRGQEKAHLPRQNELETNKAVLIASHEHGFGEVADRAPFLAGTSACEPSPG